MWGRGVVVDRMSGACPWKRAFGRRFFELRWQAGSRNGAAARIYNYVYIFLTRERQTMRDSGERVNGWEVASTDETHTLLMAVGK